ncbi:MATH domain-containing protein [Auxenochlorella protothecoides]|uniref:MATH domain-containing protein n=1 Tax=Auxenochlorella protothecoides TaxID=3075 RepID=A0A087SCM8_AUXPR|nr:MATH domain-containing protein [Auxenochlorella protothecoides]KFM23482.1 MATH domain-containing protein [Auxenochlorella protothecoides]
MSQARLREALSAGGPTTKDRGPPVSDGTLTVTPDTPEAVEWRSRRSIIDSIASCSTYLDDDDDASTNPGDLYGRFTWKIDKFSDINKRELRSNTFEVGNYKWYILVYPQGCDVANHLSLFLCVADYDKLLPGWSHFAQFTIAVVNRDPKASKYSDTLHRFCKKEHDWGWKKFMELGKVGEGFTLQDSLVIKAQVQILRDRPHRPFRCLDAQYRRELVRVYLSNVEGIARRFGFRGFWAGLAPPARFELSCDAAGPLLKAAVKRFFNEKEVTSTLVMDGLVAGCKALEAAGRAFLAGGRYETPSGVLIDAVRGVFFFAGDVVAVLEALLGDALPPAPAPDRAAGDAAAGTRAAGEPDDVSRDSVERDERRLADLGRWIMETFAAAEIARLRLEAAWIEAETIKRQDALIREEELLSQEEQLKAALRSEPQQRLDSAPGLESPGLDDFAHMGLINDLLE